MDKIIDFNELKNKVNEKDIDNFESYIYSLYYKMAEGKLTMAEFTREMTAYMENNNISQDKFLKIQTKLMERYGLDTKGFEEQIKALGLDKLTNNPVDYEQARKTMSFQEKYKDRIKVKPITEYYIKNDKNNACSSSVNAVRSVRSYWRSFLHLPRTPLTTLLRIMLSSTATSNTCLSTLLIFSTVDIESPLLSINLLYKRLISLLVTFTIRLLPKSS